MSKPDRFILNRNEGVDIVHRDPVEECNVDDADGRESVDAKTAAALIASGQARACEHCIESEAT
jgi:hypothetical protein